MQSLYIRIFLIVLLFFIVLDHSGQQARHSNAGILTAREDSILHSINIPVLRADSATFKKLFTAVFDFAGENRIHGDYGKAMQYDYFALRLAETYGFPEEIARAYNNIGISHYRNKSFDKAESYYLKSAGIRTFLQDTAMLADTYYNLGNLYDELGKNDEALKYYVKSLELFELKSIFGGMADVYNGLAGHYYMLGKTDSVGVYAGKAIEMYEFTGNKEAIAYMLINMGALRNSQGFHSEALTGIQKGIDIATQTGNLNQLRQGYKSLSETYSYLGDFQNAWLNHINYVNYKDSVFNREKALIIEELETQYETDKARRELDQKKAELLEMEIKVQKSKNIRNVVALALLIAVIIVAAAWWRLTVNRKHTLILGQKNKELETLNATKDKFFSIISHDLKSPVTSMARLAEGLVGAMDWINKDEMKTYLSALSRTTENLNDFLKKLLDWALSQKEGFKPVLEEYAIGPLLKEVIDTAQTQAHLNHNRIICECDNEHLILADKPMFQTVLRNLLSNALRFSHPSTDIFIRTSILDDGVKFSVINSGNGIHEDDLAKLFTKGLAGRISAQPETGSGLGLILCHEFIKLHGGTIFVENHSPQQTCFSFIIPDLRMKNQ
jgi:signal transduction histidine kinase